MIVACLGGKVQRRKYQMKETVVVLVIPMNFWASKCF